MPVDSIPEIVFDRAQMLTRFGGDEELMQSILDSFLEESPELIGNINLAVTEKNAEALKEYCHALKGSSANVNAQVLENAARRLEETINGDNFEDLISMVSGIEAEFDNLRKEITR